MEYALLRSLRALGPGLICIGYVDLFFIVVLDDDPIFWAMDTARLVIAGYIVGGVYGTIASSVGRDKWAFKGVEASLLSALSEIDSNVIGLSWRADVSPCFYQVIDNDKSLRQKAQGVFFNGFIVTTSFDAVWLSVLATVLGGVVVLAYSNWTFLVIGLAMAVLGYVVWSMALSKHCKLGKEQAAVIKKRFSDDFSSCLCGRK